MIYIYIDLEIAVYDVLVVEVLHGPQERPDEISRFFLVVVCLRNDAIKKFAT